eukprot:CAMPEP_0117681548 /NCGR_PEP_ID=MMETSP0804-20121206/19052_1 /TAXON_ID=1074897 /ORGANISM="Tetraselmis astigmatica, Strain CCMP880" /LENGTH=348 /DNA_ID=CAMNT_0005491335 /DNA_START=31 /DNA_END=1077 /DNA_ORIENTATION=+
MNSLSTARIMPMPAFVSGRAAPTPCARVSRHPQRMVARRAVAQPPEGSVPKLDVAICGEDEGCLIEHWIDAYQSSGNSKRKMVVGGNWKSNGTLASVTELVNGINQAVKDDKDFFEKVDVIVAPPMLHLAAVKSAIDPAVKVAAQNCHFTGNGAYTGEVTADQLADFGIEWVIVGHSERRADPASGYGVMANESSELVAKKTAYAISKGLNVIACIGETLEQREAGATLDVCKEQLAPIVAALSEADWDKVVLAYEPVWAIGTGKSATKEDAQTVHEGIRGYLATAVSPEVASAVRIQYGGSVKPDSAADLGAQLDIDGFLVGGAALAADSFQAIVVNPVSLYPTKFA